MASESLISIFFRLLNFSIIIGVAVYLVKKMLPSFHEKIAAKHKAHQDLTQKNRQLVTQQRDLEQKIDSQEQVGKNLHDQIVLWSSVFDQHLETQTEERKKRFAQSQERSQVQAERLTRAHVQSVVFSRALRGAQAPLISHFAQQQAGRQFMASVLQKMSKEI